MEILLPNAFKDQMLDLLGEELPSFLNELEQAPPLSIRYNPFKHFETDAIDERVSWASNAYYLNERKSFTADPLFHAGVYYVQEASSMMLEQAFRAAYPDTTPGIVLDLCAAPGGKSTHLLSLINGKGILISNEIHPQRNSILRQNLARWGCGNVIITRKAASEFQGLNNLVDLLVCDAPCSGEGMFRKDPPAINEWSISAIHNCSLRQSAILKDISSVVKSGGYLVYSTCTYNEMENDMQVNALLKSGEWKTVQFDLTATGAIATKYGWQCFPHHVKGEGFYISLLKKVSGDHSDLSYSKNKIQKTNKVPAEIPKGYHVAEKNNYYNLYPENLKDEMETIAQAVWVKQAGIPFGELKGKDFIPSAELALANAELNYPHAELDYDMAIRFLRCENTLHGNFEKGWNLVTYKNHPLGWIKSIQSRINNYYPRNWRILKDADKL